MADPRYVFMRPHKPEGGPYPLKTLSIRLPLPAFERLEVMAEAAELSLNAMAIQLIEWGTESAISSLPPEFAHELVNDFPNGQIGEYI